MGRRSRRRGARDDLAAPETEYLRPGGRRARAARRAVAGDAARVRGRGVGRAASREDAWQRSAEFLFERLAVRWQIAGAEPLTRQKELLGRYRLASQDERRWIREVLREHLGEHFPDMAPP